MYTRPLLTVSMVGVEFAVYESDEDLAVTKTSFNHGTSVTLYFEEGASPLDYIADAISDD